MEIEAILVIEFEVLQDLVVRPASLSPAKEVGTVEETSSLFSRVVITKSVNAGLCRCLIYKRLNVVFQSIEAIE